MNTSFKVSEKLALKISLPLKKTDIKLLSKPNKVQSGPQVLVFGVKDEMLEQKQTVQRT